MGLEGYSPEVGSVKEDDKSLICSSNWFVWCLCLLRLLILLVLFGQREDVGVSGFEKQRGSCGNRVQWVVEVVLQPAYRSLPCWLLRVCLGYFQAYIISKFDR